MPCFSRAKAAKGLIFFLAGAFCLLAPFASRAGNLSGDTGGPVRVIYLEGGEYTNYERVLYGFLGALHRNGLLAELPALGKSQDMWSAISRLPPGRLQFLSDGYYSSEWDDGRRETNKAAIFKRLRDKGDVDLILALGTWAGVDMVTNSVTDSVTNSFDTPVMVLSVTDAYSAGIVKTPLESGRDHVYVSMDPNWLYRQLVFFHDLFRFKRLGVTYDDSREGRNAVGLRSIERAAALMGFEIVACSGQLDLADLDEAYRRLLDCHRELAGKVDAMYITASSAVTADTVAALVEPFNRRKIPTFGQDAKAGVEKGILLDIARNDPEEEGGFAAEALLEMLRGTPPGKARHLFDGMIYVSLNMDTADRIGWRPPFELLQFVDVLYRNNKRFSVEKGAEARQKR
ncbi:MAG: ABC transporter substrate-binding protein [Candidatus Accumulibacter sp.]|jgi:ABC-type uncharacterized transport system substrate-binding protein|nr:ABC transporter substrate-binding protein [Accumulibacter sp.]